ncbi:MULTISPECIES: FABP family protein [Streptomyces]|uniref:Ferric nitrobindin-like protein n=2 Tax=Streptomyces TaxID=1883 RepID=A0A7H8NA71_9ACTN|nr:MULTISPECIES: FABP family protein [Streptomyces]MBC3986327.1 FABP family protein [Streptomyces buecherae]MBC3991441.1 FABP family protein [Streptomyces buecherae]QKW50648.1 FABP family protein [Streptomyces buecherae]QNJ41691.1 FABP family protein [Streptomyces buecherae]WEV27034.1 FABP family protein [Streptomyces sp. 71268]
MIEIPSDLHPDLVPLAFLLGNWEGAGVFDFPGAEKCNFGQEATFTHDGRDFIEYVSHTWELDSEGKKVRPLETESGYWRIDKDRKVEVVMIRDQGVVEIWYGELADQKPQIDLVTDAVARTAAAGPYTGGKRLYGYVKSDLMWVGEKATPEVPLRPYMSAHLKKVVDPREWAKDLKDLPDDGIAFFR